MSGVTIGKYEILAEIGQGGMSTVYKARDTVLGRFVALKVLAANLAQKENVRRRFYREAKVLSKFDHPNIVRIYDFSGLESPQMYIASEFVDGISLKTLLEAEGRFEEGTALLITQEVLKGLFYIHGHNIIHRDIKPSNLLIDKRGAILITDFGVARDQFHEQTQATLAGSMIGTLAYMPFEQINGLSIDHRVDIYALGVTLYEFVTGVKPFRESLVSSLIASISRGAYEPPHRLVPSLSPMTSELIAKAMSLRPEGRYGSTREMISILEKHPAVKCGSQLISISEVQNLPPADPSLLEVTPLREASSGRKSWVSAASIFVLVLSAFASYWILTQEKAVPPPVPVVRNERPIPPPTALSEPPPPQPVVVQPERGTETPPPEVREREPEEIPAPIQPERAELRTPKPKPIVRKRPPPPALPVEVVARPDTPPKPKIDRRALAESAYRKGQQAVREGEVRRAVDYFEEALKNDESLAEAHREIGRLHLALQEGEFIQRAIRSFEQYLRLRPAADDREPIVEILDSLRRSQNRN